MVLEACARLGSNIIRGVSENVPENKLLAWNNVKGATGLVWQSDHLIQL